MIDVKANFKSQYGQDLSCRFCPEIETQAHLLVCREIINDLDVSGVSYEDIFEDISKQEAIAKVYSAAMRIRNSKLKEHTSKILSS